MNNTNQASRSTVSQSSATANHAMPKGAYWEPKIGAPALTVLPGDHMVTDDAGVAVMTLLGSCVAACIRDPAIGVGGLNHFLLPGTSGAGQQSARYGSHAMEVLINNILRRGGQKQRLEAKVFGGGNVIDVSAKETVGDRNAKFVTEWLQREGIRLLASDLGGDKARRVFYFPDTGRASVLRLASAETRKLRDQEARLNKKAVAQPAAGGVELF